MNTPYRDIVETGGLVFISGKSGNPHGRDYSTADARIETAQALVDLAASLQSVGMGPRDVIKITVYLTDISDWDAMNECYLKFFGEHRPARSSVGVAALLSGSRIEIDAIACRRA